MTEIDIRQALEMHLAAMPGLLPTVWQNKTPVPAIDTSKPYQKAAILWAKPEALGLEELSTWHKGIFQVSVCYPSGDGTFKIETYAAALQRHFAAGTVLNRNGAKVRVRGKPSIADPVTISPYMVPVSIRFESILT